MANQDASTAKIAARIRQARVIAILRGSFDRDGLLRAATVLVEEGLTVMEVASNSPNAMSLISTLRAGLGFEAVIGAGTCRTADDVNAAIDAGAQFTVAPNLDIPSIAVARAVNRLHLPGVFTGSEIATAVAAGANMVKLFPCDAAGPKLIRALRAPFADVEFIAVGGVGAMNAGEYLRAGAAAVGVGSSLSRDMGNLEVVRQNAASIRMAIDAATGPMTEST